MESAFKRLAIACGILAAVSVAFTMKTGLAMYKSGCYWELMTWPHWRIPYPVQSAVRYAALTMPLMFLTALTGVGVLHIRRKLR